MSPPVMYRVARALPVLVLGLLLNACGSDKMTDLHTFVAQEKVRQKGAIEPLPAIKPYETFAYDANGLRDPFEPMDFGQSMLAASGSGGGLAPDLNRPKEELEGYPLDSLRMVGTLQRGGVMEALVKTQDGTVHRVKTGNYLGQNNGKITLVTEDKVELTEIVSDGAGGWLERQAAVALSE